MQENFFKKKNPPKNLEREKGKYIYIYIRENYAQNRRDSDKFIVKRCE